MIIDTIYKDLLVELKENPNRFKHVTGVRDTALEFGKKYNLDLEKLEIAALLHDITKYYTLEQNKKIIDKHFEETDRIYKYYNEKILHAFSAYVLAKEKYNIKSGEILNSILNHTIGRPNMSMYEKVIFISDYTEPNRTYKSCIKVRKIAMNNIDEAVFTAIDDSIKFYEAKGELIPLTAYEARHFYRKLLEVQHD
jgi:predicted HD superfamily hydrolase involved in NAD metabolism